MSTEVIVDVEREVWGGYNQAVLPVGQWSGGNGVAGDGTGGTIIVALRFQAAGAARVNAQIYSLEQISVLVTGSDSGRIAHLNTVNLGSDQEFQRGLGLRGLTGLASAAFDPREVVTRSLLGGQQTPAVEARLQLSIVNGAGLSLIFHAQGYIWGPRSRSALGGPVYPPGALYGS